MKYKCREKKVAKAALAIKEKSALQRKPRKIKMPTNIKLRAKFSPSLRCLAFHDA